MRDVNFAIILISGYVNRKRVKQLKLKRFRQCLLSLRVKRNKQHGNHNHHNIALAVTSLFWLGTITLCIFETVVEFHCFETLKVLEPSEETMEMIRSAKTSSTTYITLLILKMIFLTLQVTNQSHYGINFDTIVLHCPKKIS